MPPGGTPVDRQQRGSRHVRGRAYNGHGSSLCTDSRSCQRRRLTSLTGLSIVRPREEPKFSYRVRTIITSDGETTAFSDRASVETWRRAFTSPLQQGGVNESVAGHCIVQRVSPGSLTHPGNLILLSIRGASDAELTLSRVTISNAAPSGDDFDSAAPPVDLTTSPVTVTAGLSLPLQPVALNVDVDEPLLVAFDVDTAGNARVARGVAHTAYLKAPPPGGTIIEAGTQDRAAFTEQPNELWIVDAFEIATKWPPIP